MYIFKKVKFVLLSTGLALGLSAFISVSSYAYTPGTATYTAVSGDSLFKVSQVFHTTVANLMNENNLKNSSLNIGQVLKVPGDTYTVQKGDTLFLISQKYKMPIADLRRANNIYTDKLDVGQRLAVPAAVSTADLDLLSRLIMAEAQGEPYQAKVAVGAVVMSRVSSGLFADSVNGVIYQKINGYYQFTPVVNGWINKPADSDSINAAKEALNGVDPTNGALWYYDDSTTNPFMLAKKVAIKISNMVFAY